MKDVVDTQPFDREAHVILDNFAAHKTEPVKDFLERHPNVNLHLTSTHSSWLNRVESWSANSNEMSSTGVWLR